jgi:hypothetical protein
MYARIKSHTYNDSVYKKQCHNLYDITEFMYKITK